MFGKFPSHTWQERLLPKRRAAAARYAAARAARDVAALWLRKRGALHLKYPEVESVGQWRPVL
jgi:hypothetical protein